MPRTRGRRLLNSLKLDGLADQHPQATLRHAVGTSVATGNSETGLSRSCRPWTGGDLSRAPAPGPVLASSGVHPS